MTAIILQYLISLFIFILCSGIASAGVTAFDAVTSIKNPIKLQALTKGRFFSEGGKLVEFFIDEKHIGTTLSGGDGYAFLKYIPQSKGLKRIKLKTADESDEAMLLVTDKKDKVILIAIEGSLFESTLSFKPAKGAKEAIGTISQKYRIIYLSMIGIKQSRKWLQENKLYESIVFSWDGENLINDLREKDINIYAIVGSPDMLAEIKDIRKFSFKETDNGTEVESWSDILKQLQ
jgi:hypothetical protein